MIILRDVSTEDRGPVIKVVAWLLLVIACLATSVKVLSKWVLAKKINMDDVHAVLALVCSAVNTVMICVQVDAGLGRDQMGLTDAQKAAYGKAEYTADIFYVLSIGFAKWALLAFLVTLALERKKRLGTQVVTALNIVTVVAAIFAIAFQCGLPEPWDVLRGRKCFDRAAFWIAFGTLDILVDIATLILPLYLLNDLQMRTKRRVHAIFAFSSRTLMIPVIITRLIFITRNTHSPNRTYADYTVAVSTLVHLATSILTTCMPFLKPILEGLQHGAFASEIPEQRAGAERTGDRSYWSSGLRPFNPLSKGSGSRQTDGVRLSKISGGTGLSANGVVERWRDRALAAGVLEGNGDAGGNSGPSIVGEEESTRRPSSERGSVQSSVQRLMEQRYSGSGRSGGQEKEHGGIRSGTARSLAHREDAV